MTFSISSVQRALRQSHAEFVELNDDELSFHQWLQTKYGIALKTDPNGYYYPKYEVSNEKLYLIFQLKYLNHA